MLFERAPNPALHAERPGKKRRNFGRAHLTFTAPSLLVHDRHLSATTADVQAYVQHVMTSFCVRDYKGPSTAGRRPDPHIVRNVRSGASAAFPPTTRAHGTSP